MRNTAERNIVMTIFNNELNGKFNSQEIKEYVKWNHLNPNEYLKYHTSWEWLMPLLIKIEKIREDNWYVSTSIIENNFSIMVRNVKDGAVIFDWMNVYYNEFANSDKFTNIYEGVYRFIEWYNNKDKDGKK